jgi:hypothetical protein
VLLIATHSDPDRSIAPYQWAPASGSSATRRSYHAAICRVTPSVDRAGAFLDLAQDLAEAALVYVGPRQRFATHELEPSPGLIPSSTPI